MDTKKPDVSSPGARRGVNRGRRGVFVPDLAAKPAPLVVVQPAGVLDAVSEKPFGTVANRCTPDTASIPWLSLTGVPTGPGIFAKVTFIQRLNTVGGIAPSTAGSVVGEKVQVPYTADYLFYRVR